MANVKIVIGDKSGKTKQIEYDAKPLMTLSIGDTFKGELIDMPGYEFLITGGSDSSGFPMRKDLKMAGKKKVLLVSGVGLKPTRKGMRLKKTVAGTQVSQFTAQINVKTVKVGATPLFDATADSKEEKGKKE